MSLTTQLISLLILLILSGVFSGIETALISVNMIKVKTFVKEKRKGAKQLLKLKQNPRRMIITLLIGNNVVNIGAAALATFVFTNLFGSSGVGIATGLMTFLILVFGEITPKTFAAQNSTQISLAVSKPILWLSVAIYPIVKVFEWISTGMMKLLGSSAKEQLSEEELKTIVSMGRQQGILDRETARIMHNVIEFEGTTVTEIMTPDAEVRMLNGDLSVKKIIDYVIKTPYSRYPVYVSDKDEIVGVLDVDDVLKYVKNKKLDTKVKNIVRKAYFVPESKEIDDLLMELSTRKTPMAIVVDEYSHVLGVVTIEDILEEIVGEIFDKSKKSSVYIKKVNSKETQVDAKTPINEINKHLKVGLTETKFDTIAGFIEHKLQRIPMKGEKIKFKKHTIEIDKVSEQGIKSVKIYKE